ncbi:hypothetical protein [Neomoorella glycerini]|nr:hypothetical protein [Moorella glycerini]
MPPLLPGSIGGTKAGVFLSRHITAVTTWWRRGIRKYVLGKGG